MAVGGFPPHTLLGLNRVKEKNGPSYLHFSPNNVMAVMPAGSVMQSERFASINTELHNRSEFSILM